MIDLKAIYRKVGTLLPRRLAIKIRRALDYAGIESSEIEWLGMVIFTSFIVFAIPFLLFLIYAQLSAMFELPIIPVKTMEVFFISLGLALLTLILFIVHLYTIISIRAEAAENVFPDFLYLISSNIRSGMIPFQAFGASIRPELGILAYEAKKAYEIAGATNSITEAFRYISRRIKSTSIEKFTDIFEKTIKSGGRAADIIKDYADDFRRLVELREELSVQTKGYVAFLLFVAAIILPFLIAVSGHYIKVLQSLSSIAPEGSSTSMGGLSVGMKVDLTPEQFIIIGVLFIIATSLSTSLLIGLIRKGDVIRGLKYFPVLVFTSLFVLFLSIEGLKGMMPIG